MAEDFRGTTRGVTLKPGPAITGIVLAALAGAAGSWSGSYLPDLLPASYPDITVRELLNHTSGLLPGYTNEVFATRDLRRVLVYSMNSTGNADGSETPYVVKIAAATFDPEPAAG
jgi:hypothetical protein